MSRADTVLDTVHPLHGQQIDAVRPDDSVWLSASAGTGKTQVLSSRVLRLLLQPGTEPSQILCLTFTKAGATEMAARINEKLARWVRQKSPALANELKAIGADYGPQTQARARTLFASVLDCPGGGLRIDTIHAFAQWLLGAFPHEAGLTPGTRAMEDRDRTLLARQVLSDLLVDAQASGNSDQIDALAALSLDMAPDKVEAWLLRCAEARAAWHGPGAWQPPLRPKVNRLLGLEADADESGMAEMCADTAFPVGSLHCCQAAYKQWNGVKGQAGRGVIDAWLRAQPDARLADFDDLFKTLFTQKDTIKDQKSLEKFEEHFGSAAEDVLAAMLAIRERRTLFRLSARLAPALALGRDFALAWDAAKIREGLIDFDDQIRSAAALLHDSALSDWIRYKLDRRFDHILVDEAQDTNEAQWRIIDALTGDFFSGLGARDNLLRTLFVVGDYKQAIFRFQGTSPENFEAARRRVKAAMLGAAENADALRSPIRARQLRELGLDRSFRTAQPVLDVVDRAIAHVGPQAFGLKDAPDRHVGEERPGTVVMWRPVGTRADDAELEKDPEPDSDEDAQGWLSRPDRQLAERIAQQVKAWLDEGYPLFKGRTAAQGPRRAAPGDVMVLVRKRRELAGLIVARLHAAGVPVAGVDRLRLGAPLAVRDLLAALRFAVQPLDDLELANLLVSPLIGWSQEQLLKHGHRPKGVHLWSHLRRASHDDVAGAMDLLTALLARADYEPPQALLHWLLAGPWAARRKLAARLGQEANDPIDELLNAAHAFAASDTPSLIGFLHWFDAGEGELKREAGQGGDLVRVMTVHGAKGLQAPIVILADATGDPSKGAGVSLTLAEPLPADQDRKIPLPALRKDERFGRIADAHDRALREEGEEHWRLLYVAMTRAEEALFVGGSLAVREKDVAEGSWYAHLRSLGGAQAWIEDPVWGSRLEHCPAPTFAHAPGKPVALPLPLPEPLPRWLTAPPGAEPRPLRPLAPSSLGEEQGADPPLPPGTGKEAARRGVLVHRLLERLPEVPTGMRRDAALRWLERSAGDLPGAARDEIAAAALKVLDVTDWAALFGPDSLPEVPIAALVGDQVVAGTIDRLLIEPARIRLIDFKTARRPPETLEQVPASNLRQMAAYVAALEATFPGRTIEAALLFTQSPQLMALPARILEPHKLALLRVQETFLT